VSHVFATWDEHAEPIAAVYFTWQTGIGDEAVALYEEYYGVGVHAFLEFLRTLGLRHRDGRPNLAWQRLETEALARGWEPRDSI